MVNCPLGLSVPEGIGYLLAMGCSGKNRCKFTGKAAALSHRQPMLSVAGAGVS